MKKKTDLVKNTAIITIGKICTQFLSFFLLPLYTSILSTSEYGTVDLLSTYQLLLLPVVFFQIERALFRFLVDIRLSEEKQKVLISTTFSFVVWQAIFLCIIFGVVSLFLHYEYLWNLYFYIIAVAFSSYMLQSSRGLGHNAVYAIGSFIIATTTIIGNILFLAVFHLGAKGMLTSYVIGNLIGGLYVAFTLKIYKCINFSCFSRDRLMECFRYSIPLIPENLAWWVMGASDRIVVSMMMGVAYNGVLSISHKFPSVFTAFFMIFYLSWSESAAIHIQDADRDEYFGSVINTTYNLFSSLAIGIIACLPFVFNIFVPNPDYHGAYQIIPIYMLASMFNVIQGLYSVVYFGLKKTRELVKTTILGAALNLIVCIALIKWIGLYAAALSSVIGYGANAIWRYLDLKKYVNAKLKVVYVVSSMIAGSFVCFCYYTESNVLKIIGFLGAVIYAVAINKELLKNVISTLGKSRMRFLHKE